MSEELLRRHLVRAEPHATAFQERIRRITNDYVPPYNVLIGGWDTRFMPMKEGQAYYPIALVWFTVNVMASLMGMRPPKFNMEPKTSDDADRKSAADAELLIRYEQQRQSMREVHLDLCKTLSLKGRAGIKIGYEGEDLWTENIDNIENLWASFANDSFRKVNAYTYHSLIDIDEAKDAYGWKDESPNTGGGFWAWAATKFNAARATKSDPLGRWAANTWGTTSSQNPPYDGLNMIDFHFRNADNKVVNQIWIGSQMVNEKVLDMEDFPYITVNAETEPGSPFGIGDAEPVMILQREIAQLKTKWHEAIRRNGLDTWIVRNIKGLAPIDLNGGGRYFMVSGTREEQNIEPLKYPIDDIGYHMATQELWEDYRRTTGIPPEVLGGGNISAGTSGYAMAIKFQSVITRMGPRQTRLTSFYQKWVKLTLKNMEKVTPDSTKVINDNYFVTIDWESVTPKDFAQEVTSLATAVAGGLMSHRTAIEELGNVSEDEQTYIEEWNSNPKLNPQGALALQTFEGQAKALANPQSAPGAAAGADAAKTNAAAPSMAGENQFTAPEGAISQPGAPNVVAQNPGG